MPREARDHEHRVALDGGSDGLAVQRRVIAESREWLVPGGHLLVETGRCRVEATTAAMNAAGLDAEVTEDEVGGTVVVGRFSA